jgi:hypothetical protein
MILFRTVAVAIVLLSTLSAAPSFEYPGDLG